MADNIRIIDVQTDFGPAANSLISPLNNPRDEMATAFKLNQMGSKLEPIRFSDEPSLKCPLPFIFDNFWMESPHAEQPRSQDSPPAAVPPDSAPPVQP